VENEPQKAEPDIRYLAISIDTTIYAELTDIEYRQCVAHSFCKISGPIGIINNEAHCSARTFKDKQRHCPMVDTTEKRPFFATYGDKTFFSSPVNYVGNLVCPTNEARSGDEAKTGKINFSGVGTIHLNPTCFVHLPDGQSVSAQYETNIATDLGISTLNEAFKYVPSVENYTFTKKHISVFSDTEIPELDFSNININSIKYMTELAISPSEVAKHLIRLFIFLIVVCIILAILYCTVPKFRRWVKACCLIKPPNKYWRSKGYDHPILFLKKKFGHEEEPNPQEDAGAQPGSTRTVHNYFDSWMRNRNKLYREKVERMELKREQEQLQTSDQTATKHEQVDFKQIQRDAERQFNMIVRDPFDPDNNTPRIIREPSYAIPAPQMPQMPPPRPPNHIDPRYLEPVRASAPTHNNARLNQPQSK
jgi:hypothetical protein